MGSNRIKSLDGLRAIAVIMVLLGHGKPSFPEFIQNSSVFWFVFSSHTGVMIFFVISGYLITKLLLNERDRNGEISLKNFYIRRVCRIFPVFYLYISTIIILKYTIYPDIFSDWKNVLFCSLFLWNYKNLFYRSAVVDTNGGWFMGHYWSLAMEEQFYLLFPIIFKKIRNIVTLEKILIAIILIMPVFRILTYSLSPDSRGQISMMLHTGGDSILIGCLGALLERSEKFMGFLKRAWENNICILFSAIYLFLIDGYLHHKFGGMYSLTIGYSMTNVIILFFMFWCIHVSSPIHNFLNNRFISQIGILSYSLYIWQQLILTQQYHSVINKFPCNFILVFAIAFVSYYCVEKPILRLKSRFNK